jgi:hypothetical protein
VVLFMGRFSYLPCSTLRWLARGVGLACHISTLLPAFWHSIMRINRQLGKRIRSTVKELRLQEPFFRGGRGDVERIPLYAAVRRNIEPPSPPWELSKATVLHSKLGTGPID